MTALPVVLRSHHDGRFAVAVTDRTSDGQLVVMFQESVGSGQAVTVLSEAELVQMLELVREAR